MVGFVNEEVVVTYYPGIFMQGLTETTKYFWISGVPAEIRTENNLNTSLRVLPLPKPS
jgi:hypothetical protein